MARKGTKRTVATYLSEDIYEAMLAVKQEDGVPMMVQFDKALRAWLMARSARGLYALGDPKGMTASR